jgi:hypothetical protein
VPARRPKLKLPNLDMRPLTDPLLTGLEIDGTDAPEYPTAGGTLAPLLTLTMDPRGDSADIDSVPLLISPGAEETPVMPCRAR